MISTFLYVQSIITPFYLYIALTTYYISKKTNTKYPWFAFIPFLNIWLWHTISRRPLKFFIVYLLLPIISILLVPILTSWSTTKYSPAYYTGLFLYGLIFLTFVYIECVWSGSIAFMRGYSRNLGYFRAMAKSVAILLLTLSFIFTLGAVIGEFQEEYDQETKKIIERNSNIASILLYISIFLYIINLILLGIFAWRSPKTITTTPK